MTIPVAAEKSFEVTPYLEERASNTSFVMVEIGHNQWPVAYQQPFEFTGDRAYIGVEAWLRVGEEELADLREEHGDEQNIFYIAQEIGGDIERVPIVPSTGEPCLSWYRGPFDTQTLLPDEAADEVFAGNVFTDPHIGPDEKYTAKLLAEVSRIVDRNGMIILRETGTPQHSRYITDEEFLAGFGLRIAACIKRKRWEDDWSRLQAVYKGDPKIRRHNPGSFYLFLSKIAAD